MKRAPPASALAAVTVPPCSSAMAETIDRPRPEPGPVRALSARQGLYSLYSQGIEDENYLRGVQVAADDGTVTFASVFPAAYSGRWPHIHFEVYPDLDMAMAAGDRLVTSQLAFPEEVCDAAYATDGYEQSVRNLAQTSLDSDMVFSDDRAEQQLATVTGRPSSGYTATLTVPVA